MPVNVYAMMYAGITQQLQDGKLTAEEADAMYHTVRDLPRQVDGGKHEKPTPGKPIKLVPTPRPQPKHEGDDKDQKGGK